MPGGQGLSSGGWKQSGQMPAVIPLDSSDVHVPTPEIGHPQAEGQEATAPSWEFFVPFKAPQRQHCISIPTDTGGESRGPSTSTLAGSKG